MTQGLTDWQLRDRIDELENELAHLMAGIVDYSTPPEKKRGK